MITYHDAELDEVFEFVTNLHHSIPPGVIVQLYRMRWDIEKVFDDFKNKLKGTAKVYKALKKAIPKWLKKHRRITQISVKFIRWARTMFLRASSWQQSMSLLAYEYSLE